MTDSIRTHVFETFPVEQSNYFPRLSRMWTTGHKFLYISSTCVSRCEMISFILVSAVGPQDKLFIVPILSEESPCARR